MPIIKIGQHKVDVASRRCGPALPCYWLGFDKGTFVQGRGYIKYRDKPKPVCWTRHRNGCPMVGICLDCRTIQSPAGQLEGKCGWCGGQNLQPYTEKTHDGTPDIT